jgi:hypothetical protein
MRPRASRADFEDDSLPSYAASDAEQRWRELVGPSAGRVRRRRLAKYHRRVARKTVATARAHGFAITTVVPEGQDALRREADRYGLDVEFELRLGLVQAVVRAGSSRPQLGPLARFLSRPPRKPDAVE